MGKDRMSFAMMDQAQDTILMLMRLEDRSSPSRVSFEERKTVITILVQPVLSSLYSDYSIPASIPNIPNYNMSSVHSFTGGLRH